MSVSPIIIYRYDTSPFGRKIDNILTLKGIPHEQVKVSPTLPRPEITDNLGITYRRIPVLAIGNDVYCDTSLIVTALERRFPASHGFGTVFPPNKQTGKVDTTLIKAFAKYYAENAIFPLAATLIPWDKLPAPFIKDRSALAGAPIDPKVMSARIPLAHTTLSSHLILIEEQLSDSREWLFDTELPSLADISLHFVLAWALSLSGSTLFDEDRLPYTLKWLTRMTDLLKQKRDNLQASQKLRIRTGLDAANKIVASNHESYDVVGFDEVEASRLRVKLGGTVQVAPDDTGRNYPTTGKLVALSREELVLEVQGSQGLLRCHFPRLGFSVKSSASNKL